MTQPTSGQNTDASAPLAGFANCHEGIVAHLNTLGELPALLAPVARAHQIAHDTEVFFQDVVFDHHADEEKNLFPAVLARATPGRERQEVQHLVDQLTAEHRSIEAQWARLQPGIAKLAKGQSAQIDASEVEDLVRRYIAHARFEEAEFLPRSETILGRDSAEMAQLGLALHMRHLKREIRLHGLRGS
jgi:hemerythrin superfamily protein